MTKNKVDVTIFLTVYAVALAMMLYYNLAHLPVNDAVYEYQAYMDNIKNGWQFRYTLVNSSLVTTWVPALIQQLTGWNAMILFRVFPPIFYALMPAFTYLIAEKYLNTRYAVISTLVVMLSSYIIYFPDMGRVGVAIAFLAGMLWALLGKRIVWTITFAVLVVFAHYAAALISVGVIGAVCLILLIWKKSMPKYYLVTFITLLVLTGIWHFGIAGYSGNVMQETLLQQRQTGYSLPQYSIGGDNPVGGALIDPKTREPAVQSAIGLNFGSISTPQRIEILANWLMVAIVTLGLYYTLRRKWDIRFKTIAVIFWGLILFTVAVPWLSVYYGGLRVYFTGSMILAVCFPVGAEKVAQKVHMPPLLLMAMVLIMYGLSTSGIIYWPFGLEKTFPVAVSLP